MEHSCTFFGNCDASSDIIPSLRKVIVTLIKNKKVKRFVNTNALKIGTLVNVSTAALIESTYKQMKTVAAEAGVTLSDQEFHCRGKFKALHASHPDEADLKAVREFARSVLGREA